MRLDNVPAETNPMKVGSKTQYGMAIVVGLGIAASLYILTDEGAAITPSLSDGPMADIIDQPNYSVAQANLDPILVQLGTNLDYTGYGLPGIVLDVETPGNVLNWTMVAWANQTTPAPTQVCSSNSVHFSAYDWVFQTNGASGAGQGTFSTTPTTVPQRLSPDGDQCFARVNATGTWHTTICIEGKGEEPLGIYDAPDGRRHFDTWDRCIDRDFQVGP